MCNYGYRRRKEVDYLSLNRSCDVLYIMLDNLRIVSQRDTVRAPPVFQHSMQGSDAPAKVHHVTVAVGFVVAEVLGKPVR